MSDRNITVSLPPGIREQLAAARQEHDAASTLPPACYTDDALFAHEREAVFLHSWCYALDGRLLSAPRMGRARDFDRTEYGLVEFQAAERDGFAYLCLDRDGPALENWLGDFSILHAQWSLADLVATRRRELEVQCNWKAFIEVFNEYYHLPTVHPDSLAGLYDAPDDVEEVGGNYATQFGVTNGSAGLLEGDQGMVLPAIPGLQGRNRAGTRYTWIYPNMTFAASSDALWVYDVLPLSPRRSQVGMTACFHPEAVQQEDFEERAGHYYARLDAALAEDLPVLELQQRGLSSPFARPGRFSSLEPSVARFAAWYARAMDATL